MANDEMKQIWKVPEPTLRRLPWYLAFLKLMKGRGEAFVSSTQIAKEINVDPSQVAKDLSFVNISGKTRVGYEISTLVDVLEDFLGFTAQHKAFLFGVGSLGAALLQDSGLKQYGLEIVGGFDVRRELAGTEINGIPVYHMDDFSCQAEGIRSDDRSDYRPCRQGAGSDRIDYRRRNQGFVELYPVPYPCAGRYRGAKYLYVCPSCCDVQPLEFNQSLIYENNSRRNELCCSQ